MFACSRENLEAEIWPGVVEKTLPSSAGRFKHLPLSGNPTSPICRTQGKEFHFESLHFLNTSTLCVTRALSTGRGENEYHGLTISHDSHPELDDGAAACRIDVGSGREVPALRSTGSNADIRRHCQTHHWMDDSIFRFQEEQGFIFSLAGGTGRI